MKSYILTILTTIISITSYGQDKKDLNVSFSSGLLTSPYYNNVRKGGYYSFDMDYYFRQRHILSSNFTSGGHDYIVVVVNEPCPREKHGGLTKQRRLFTLSRFQFSKEVQIKSLPALF